MKMKRNPYYIITLTDEKKAKLKDALEILNQVLKDTDDGHTDLSFKDGCIISNIRITSDMILRNVPREEE